MMRNSDSHMPDDQHYMGHYFSNQNHYMPTNRCDPLGMPQLEPTNPALHYMSPKHSPTSGHKQHNSRGSMNQAYSHPMSPLASMSTHSSMLGSPPMLDSGLLGHTNSNPGSPYCKIPTQPVSQLSASLYDTPPPMPRYHPQSLGMINHHSPSSNEMNQHYNTTQENLHADISTTLTHISESSDSSHQHNNYAPTPPLSQQQQMNLSPVNNNINNNGNMTVPTSHGYSQMNCNPTNNNTWNSMAGMNSQMSCPTKTNSPNHSTFSTRNESQFSYLDADYHSITSTPVSSQTQQDHYLMRPKNVLLNHSSINNTTTKSDNFNVSSLSKSETPKPPNPSSAATEVISDGNGSNHSEAANFLSNNNDNKKGFITAEKRSVIIFKVVEQIIDPSTKNVLKETVLKNEEVISSVGQVQFDLLNNNDICNSITSSIVSTNPISLSHVGSSGVLGDISHSFSVSGTTKSLLNNNTANNTSGNNFINTFETSTTNKEEENKANAVVPRRDSENSNFNGSQSANSIVDDENDEEERRQTATALLSLHSVSNTPVKEAPIINSTDTSVISAALALSTALKKSTTRDSRSPQQSTEKSVAAVQEATSSRVNNGKNVKEVVDTSSMAIIPSLAPVVSVGAMKLGLKVMAKWKDKNFYPAEVLKQVEPHKWSVKFEDAATRNLFETELIRLEYLTAGQDVMLTISGDLCIRAIIRKVIQGGRGQSSKNVEMELQYAEDEHSSTNTNGKRPTSRRHKLCDVFLNAEQSSAVLARSSRPSQGGAVFADVDLDNIVVGKRSRKVQQSTAKASESKETKKRGGGLLQPETGQLSDSDASTSNGSGTTAIKKRRKVAANVANESKSGPPSASSAVAAVEANEDEVSSESPSSLPPKPVHKSISVDVSILKPKVDSFPFLSSHYHESSLAVSPRTSRSTTMVLHMPPNELEKILGPVPSKVSAGGSGTSAKGIFEGISFMLTSGDRLRNLGGGGSSGSGNESGSGSELSGGVADRSVPFDKVYLTKQILAGGGTVYDTFEEMKASGESDCVLIADTYHRSVKYIQCLAGGIPISSHLWIIDSCKAGRLLDRDSYILPAGFSVITHSLSSDRNTLRKSAILFRGMKFYFGSRMAVNLEQLWSPVLMAAQSVIVKQDENMYKNLSRKMVDIIIGDATCAEELVARAKQVKVPVVSSEYIVQCLINGRKLPFDSAKCFHPDNTSDSSSPM